MTARLATPLDQLTDVFSQAHDDLAAALYADAFPMEADKEGRIILSGDTRATTPKLTDAVAFVGMGRHLSNLGTRRLRGSPARRSPRARPQLRDTTVAQAA